MALNIPVVVSVPGHWGIGPQWWNPAGLPNRPFHGDIDDSGQPSDPRWNGSARRSYASGAAVEAEIRAVHMLEPALDGSGNKPFLYFSFFVPNDPNASVGPIYELTDVILLGFKGASGVGHLIEIDAYKNLTPGAKPAGQFLFYKTDADTAASTHWVPENWALPGHPERTGLQPPWLDDTRVWVSPHASVGGSGSTVYAWSVNVRIPTTASGDISNNGINLSGANFKFFFAVMKETGAGVVPYVWPRDAAAPYDDATGKVLPPFASNPNPPHQVGWEDVQIGGGGPGIALIATDIGTTNPVNNQILYPKVSTDPPKVNTLYADITNSGPSIPVKTLRATFRMANWGSQPWQNYLTGTAWQEVLPTFLKLNQNAIGTGDMSANRRISFNWSISFADSLPWRNGTLTEHQCFLVTLSAYRDPNNPGAPQAVYDFVNDSAFQNLYVLQTASPVEQNAEISLVGVPKVNLGLKGRIPILRNRDVFMFVSTTNMPQAVPSGQAMQPRDLRSLLTAEQPLTRSALAAALPALKRSGGDGTIDVVPIDDLASVLTTVRYFVYADTGKKIKVGGKLRPLLTQQTSFGYIIQHTRPVVGWDHALGGNFVPTGQPNMYKLGVPDGGSKTILTRVIAYEELPQKRVGPVIAGPLGKIQASIPVAKNLPAVGSLANKVSSILLRR